MSRKIARRTERLRELPNGSIITTPFPDVEGNVAEKTSDGYWLVTGGGILLTNENLADYMDQDFTVLRFAYGKGLPGGEYVPFDDDEPQYTYGYNNPHGNNHDGT